MSGRLKPYLGPYTFSGRTPWTNQDERLEPVEFLSLNFGQNRCERGTIVLMKRSFSVLACAVAIYGGMLRGPAAAASAKDGEAVFTAKCKNCHGTDGSGNPAIAKMMNVTMKALGSAEVQAKSDADLKAVVTVGTGKMKPVAGIPAGDIDSLIAYVRTLKK